MKAKIIGISPTNDFAYKKIFGSPANDLVLISLLNAILKLAKPIRSVTIQNPFNYQDFYEDKLSVLDIKAVDQDGNIYDIEMQLEVHLGLIQRVVFYGCELYSGQMKSGDDYSDLKPVFAICLLEGTLWLDSDRVHHAFRLVDQETNRILKDTIEFHILEMGRYNLTERDLATANTLARWLYWLLHAHEYTEEELMRLFPEEEFKLATQTLAAINRITEDKQMYDATEKARRDRQWVINATRAEGESKGKIEGKIEGEIKLIRTLEGLLGRVPNEESQLKMRTLEELQQISTELQSHLRSRIS
ncbi:Rpn family recombination-promoting nuclease/putative transposase [Pirellulaceae bacterium SH449]